jgi:hypothetical protein
LSQAATKKSDQKNNKIKIINKIKNKAAFLRSNMGKPAYFLPGYLRLSLLGARGGGS